MRDLLKAILFSFYYISVARKNYLPVLLYLVLTQSIIMYVHNIFVVLLFFMGFLVASSPIIINVSRAIINDDSISNEFLSYIDKTYAKLYIKKLFYLLLVIVITYLAHILILSPFLPTNDVPRLTMFLYILLMYMIYIYTRIMFVLPAAAINIDLHLKDSFNATKGYSVKIYFLYITIIIPYLILSLLISKYAVGSEYSAVFVIISIALQIFFTILSSSLLGYIYKGLVKNKKIIKS